MGKRTALASLAVALAATPAFALMEPSGVPARLQPPGTDVPAFMLSANGVMIYQCQVSLADPNAYSWSLVAPDATLYDGGHEVARTTSPNLIESLGDGSSVSGVVRSAQAAPGALPWTLAQAQPIGETGVFVGVTTLQRVNTRGGVPPAGGCNADNTGTEARVAFSADYYFYKRRGT
ncbi:MAG TPA: DUF3455 domain-containing protein [Usitatibacter sp.]|jgi:hypothetical protein|nr:DUF3455 domain-containing protein [Usitatibacter sp.]